MASETVPPAPQQQIRLRLVGVSKQFGATRALHNVEFEVGPGEVHGLLGENGAGKSTLMKILSGVHRPDEGRVFLDEKPFAPANPIDARRRGVSMIYQELTLARDLSVEENILLGGQPSFLGFISRAKRREMALAALRELQSEEIPLDAPARTLPVASQQIIEIARALIHVPKLLIMDEPTSSLTQVDTQNLFRVIRKLSSRGVSIIYISHFLEESTELCSRYTVLRDGESVGSGEMASLDRAKIIRLMVGREIKDLYARARGTVGKPVLELRKLRGKKRAKNVSLVLHEGEILGVAGLVGAGRTETLRASFGLEPVRGGEIYLNGSQSTSRTPADRWRAGVGLVSEDRKEEGLMLNQSIADNLTLTDLEKFGKLGFISLNRQRAATREWMTRLSVKARGPQQPIGQLSGGNQQKVAIGRLLHHGASILMLDEPTRGIDVGAKAQIYHLLAELSAQGKSVLFVSSYLPELLGVCDTIAVLCRGVLVETRTASDWTEAEIINAAVGEREETPGD